MANIKSAEKRAKQDVKRRAHNMAARSRLRTSIKKVLAAIGAGDKTEATAALKPAQPVIDTMVTKGIIHSNKAARHKSELNAKIKALGAAASKATPVAALSPRPDRYEKAGSEPAFFFSAVAPSLADGHPPGAACASARARYPGASWRRGARRPRAGFPRAAA